MTESMDYDAVGQVIPETGLSADWLNETMHLVIRAEELDEDILERLRARPVRNYAQRYGVRTGAEPPGLARLNRLVDAMNALPNRAANQPKIVIDRMFIAIHNQLVRLIYGDRRGRQPQMRDISRPLRTSS